MIHVLSELPVNLSNALGLQDVIGLREVPAAEECATGKR